MATVRTDDRHYAAIAAALRETTGSAATYRPEDMAAAVAQACGEAQKAAWDTFWDEFQTKGARISYDSGFYGPGWTDVNFVPKYDIQPLDISYMFAESQITDLAGILQRQGVLLDTSKASSFGYAFFRSTITHVPRIDTRGASAPSALGSIFYLATKLETIDELVLKEDGSQTFSNAFTSCSALKNLRITGCIGQNITFTGVPLSHDSLLSVLNALKPGVSGKVYLGSSNTAKLTEAEKAIATEKGWSLV